MIADRSRTRPPITERKGRRLTDDREETVARQPVNDVVGHPVSEELLIRIKNLIRQRKRLRQLLSQHIGDDNETRIIRETAGKAMSKLEGLIKKSKSFGEGRQGS